MKRGKNVDDGWRMIGEIIELYNNKGGEMRKGMKRGVEKGERYRKVG